MNELLNNLDNLCKRLQADYNEGIQFEQHEEDRLAVYRAIEILKGIRNERNII